MASGLSNKKSKLKSALFIPLSIIEISTIHQPGKSIQQFKDVTIEHPLNGISNDPVKNAIALFLTELLYKTLGRPEADEPVFDFIKQAIQLLDELEEGVANFHLLFMIKLTKYLGFAPNTQGDHAYHFDLLNGVLQDRKPMHAHFMNMETTQSFTKLLQSDFIKMHEIQLSRTKRNELLEGLIEYYKLHMPDFHGLNSTTILHELFN